jgi:gamma-glutamyl hercynylcysteine S-oxide synthase
MTRDEFAAQLEEARARTLALIAPLTEDDLRTQHDPLMSPIIWDLGHIAQFEELWLVRNLEGPAQYGEMPGIYDPFEHPRRVRGELALPSRGECMEMMNAVRARVLDRLARSSFDRDDPLLRHGYVYAMVLQHEYQHNETILQTLQLKRGRPYDAPRAHRLPKARREHSREMVHWPGGAVHIGTDDRSSAYDNERPRHAREVAPFSIDVDPVTNGDYLEFIRDGGYGRPELWSNAGWEWREQNGVDAPKYWMADGDDWCVRVMDAVSPVDPARAVCHVSYHEAEAFARFAGKRLPSEIEWEVAAGWDPSANRMRSYPWGDTAATREHANIDQLSFGVAPMGAYSANVSPLGCYGMIGDTWEWTSSDFTPWPGYRTFPYAEYSEVFFGSEYKVLRGGSWATRPGAIRNSFRNWDYPIRRQIFSGFRCARDD